MTHPATAARAVLAAALVAGGGGLLAACSGSSGGSSANPAPTVTVTTTASGPSTTATSPAVGTSSQAGGSGTPHAQTGPAACTTSDLHIDLGQANGAAGSTIVPIEFENQSSSTCTMFGFPGVSFVSGVGGTQIGASGGENSATPRKLITLTAGAKAHALMSVIVAQNFPAGKCDLVKAHWLKVFPPGETAAQFLKYTSDTCSSVSTAVRVLNIETVQAGGGDS
jgi:hypothetical protein